MNSSSPSGGRPRPSLKWQVEHERALKVGPRPSRLVVELGAITQFLLKNELPTTNRWRRSKLMLRADSENALAVRSNTVVSPPGRSSPSASAGASSQASAG